jgi:hypothetical protein
VILDALFARNSGEPTQIVDALLGASAEDLVLRGLLREMYRELEHLLDAEVAAARPRADPGERRRVTYGILCIAGMNASLLDLGFPGNRASAARACAEWLLATLDR